MQSPLSFGGFACLTRHVKRISKALSEVRGAWTAGVLLGSANVDRVEMMYSGGETFYLGCASYTTVCLERLVVVVVVGGGGWWWWW